MRRSIRTLVVALVSAAALACGPSDEERAADRAAAIAVVERFGQQLMRVDLLADSRELGNTAREVYGPYVTTLQLGTWLSDIRSLPGRETSSPYPARIEVRDAVPFGNAAFDVTGDIVYLTSVDGDPVVREPVRIRVVRGQDGAWRISEWNSQD